LSSRPGCRGGQNGRRLGIADQIYGTGARAEVEGAFAHARAKRTISGTTNIPIDKRARTLIAPKSVTTIHASAPAPRRLCLRCHFSETHTSTTATNGRANTRRTRVPLTATIVALDDECVVTPFESVVEETELYP
jgi:hypothetical protein